MLRNSLPTLQHRCEGTLQKLLNEQRMMVPLEFRVPWVNSMLTHSSGPPKKWWHQILGDRGFYLSQEVLMLRENPLAPLSMPKDHLATKLPCSVRNGHMCLWSFQSCCWCLSSQSNMYLFWCLSRNVSAEDAMPQRIYTYMYMHTCMQITMEENKTCFRTHCYVKEVCGEGRNKGERESEGEREKERARGVRRPDDLCYDNTNVQVESWRRWEQQIPKVPRLDALCYDIENEQVDCDDVG